MSGPTLRLNGETTAIGDVDPNTTLLQWLRGRGWTGTKEGCAEGECGACAVAIIEPTAGGATYRSINSCLLPVYAAADRDVVTVEGIASKSALHPVQQAMVDAGGSQCGYCTPGFVVSMFAEYYRPGRTEFDLEAIGGNLCRCTGYRPIVDAARSLPLLESVSDPHVARLAQPEVLRPLDQQTRGRRIVRPLTLEALFDSLAKFPNAKLIAGGTDAVVEINQLHTRHATIILLDAIQSLRGLEEDEQSLTLGAGEPLANLEHALHGKCTALDQLFPLFSSRLIRQRATLGGNLCNASPIGDGPPVLLALDAEVHLSSGSGGAIKHRDVALHEFFTGYRKTQLQPGEVLSTVRVPKPLPTTSRFYKVSKRVLDDISTVAACFALWTEDGVISQARIAYGGVAATPVRAFDAEAALVGKRWTQHTWTSVRAQFEGCFTPMDDHRGSAAYRREMVVRLFDKFFTDTDEEGSLQ